MSRVGRLLVWALCIGTVFASVVAFLYSVPLILVGRANWWLALPPVGVGVLMWLTPYLRRWHPGDNRLGDNRVGTILVWTGVIAAVLSGGIVVLLS